MLHRANIVRTTTSIVRTTTSIVRTTTSIVQTTTNIRPNSGQGHSQQPPNQNQHYRPVPKPVQKPSHDEQRHWRQKKQHRALTPRQTVPQKRQKKEQKIIKQEDKDNQSKKEGKKKTNQLKKR